MVILNKALEIFQGLHHFGSIVTFFFCGVIIYESISNDLIPIIHIKVAINITICLQTIRTQKNRQMLLRELGKLKMCILFELVSRFKIENKFIVISLFGHIFQLLLCHRFYLCLYELYFIF